MATIGTLITRVETRIALASGLDVQAVDEPRFLEMLRSRYNSLFDRNWWTDYLTLGTYTTDGTTGLITGDVTGLINRVADIHSIFYDDHDDPIPMLKFNANPRHARRPSWAPYASDATKMFKVYPIDQVATLNVWFRTRLTDTQWEQDNTETEVNMDDEMLILGTVFDYLSDDGSNDDATKKYLGMYQDRIKQLEKLQLQAPIAKSNDRNGYPTRWYDGP
ncbi:MAG: hypothetical protein KKH61_21365 [Gammaproteobacteria bacterium]|uniref:Uncharacterized protein n=1 Tax=viral metagenome TaxID=1070528 RepID=A0A6H1ZAU9_9ZZZZ|nr:hypothetical protein [Gammaproteobacteria bacterium]